jgi:hypothetical protein
MLQRQKNTIWVIKVKGNLLNALAHVLPLHVSGSKTVDAFLLKILSYHDDLWSSLVKHNFMLYTLLIN